jgi:hypothetical protein
MSRVGFEPTIPAFERAKTVHALDRAAAVIGLMGSKIGVIYTALASISLAVICYDTNISFFVRHISCNV